MDSTGYYGHQKPSNHMTNLNNVSQSSVDTYNDEALFDGKRPKSNYIGQVNMKMPKQKQPVYGGQNMEAFNRSMIKQNNLRPVKDDAKKKMKNITGRTKPKHIQHDPEALREEVFALNRRLDDLKKNNERLNSELALLEAENAGYEKIIQENECFWNIGNKVQDSTQLQNLKKECTNLEEEMRTKQEQLENVEKNVKNTKLTELKIEVEVLEEECAHLKRVFKDMMNECDENQVKQLNDLEEKYYKQKNLLNFLEKDNKEMEIQLKILEGQNVNYQREINDYEEKIGGNEEELEHQKNMMKQKDILIKNLRREASNTTPSTQETTLKKELEDKEMDWRNLCRVLQDKQNEEELQNRAFKEIEESFEQQRRDDENELRRLKQELERLRNEDPDNIEVGEDLLDNAGANEAQEDETMYDEKELYSEVKKIAQKIVMRLKIQEVHENNLTHQLFGDSSTNHATITKVVQSLQNQNSVFMLYPEEARKVGHVMKKNLGCMHMHDNVELLKLSNAFREILGHYNVLSKMDQIQVDKKMYKKYVKGKEESLKEELNKAINNHSTMNIENVQKIMQVCGCKVVTEDLDYIHFQMFLKTNDLDNLDFGWLIEISDAENLAGDEIQEYNEQVNAIENNRDLDNSDEN